MLNEQIKFMLDTKFENAWDFVSMFYPDYCHCDSIALSDDLQKLIDDEYEEGSEAERILHETFNGIRDVEKIQREADILNCDIYLRAIKGFLKILNQETTVKIIRQSDDTGDFKVYLTNVDGELIGAKFLYSGSIETCFEFCEGSKLKIINKDNFKDYFREKYIEQLRGPIFNLLSYAFDDINWDYSKLTDKERELITEREFNKLKNLR